MKTIAVFGVGPALGLSVARRFGREGFRVALVARNQDKLDGYVKDLARDGIEAAGFPADLAERANVPDLVAAITARFGGIDVVAYGPGGVDRLPRPTLEVEPEGLLGELTLPLLTPIAVVRAVLPGMLERGGGALLFAQGSSVREPVPALASVGIGMAGLTNYLHTLHTELAPRGIYVGTLLIGGLIDRSEAMRIVASGGAGHFDKETLDELVPAGIVPLNPDDLADTYWDMYTRRDRVEELVA